MRLFWAFSEQEAPLKPMRAPSSVSMLAYVPSRLTPWRVMSEFASLRKNTGCGLPRSVTVVVEEMVFVAVGTATVVVVWVTPTQEQALE